jgi:hypothetical protein
VVSSQSFYMVRFPTSLIELSIVFLPLPFSEQVGLLREWKLLPKKLTCGECLHTTTLRTPAKDDRNDPGYYTPCNNAACHSRLNYKSGSIFFMAHLPMDALVLLLYCFALQLNPAHTLRVLGHDICSGTSVENFNKRIRQSIAKDVYLPNGYIADKLGGRLTLAEAVAAAPRTPYKQSVHLFPWDAYTICPVEVDEGVCVCVCVCLAMYAVCVCLAWLWWVCVQKGHTHTHTHTLV